MSYLLEAAAVRPIIGVGVTSSRFIGLVTSVAGIIEWDFSWMQLRMGLFVTLV